MTSKLLLVEPSATMRYVLENYAQSLGFTVVATGDYKQAEEALHQQYQSYGGEFAGVLLGWSIVPDEGADALINTLEASEFNDLPVVVMSTDMRAETRAWVAGREHTAVLPWKEYQSVDGLLQKLVQQPIDDRDTFTTKFNNADINVLIVDDSVSIRFALRDLFELQGYRVSVASGHHEAIAAAKQSPFDIAILDFYLQDGTGDVLCRKLISDPATGQLTCAMLTGTYADHIIKRSLRAGAVECMFKNESSELLLARVDALSRFVRQRKRLGAEQRRLDLLVDTLAGATMVVGANDVITYVSEQAASLLGFDSRAGLLGQSASNVVDLPKIRESGSGKFRAQWRDASQGLVSVVYRQVLLDDNNDAVLNFKLLPGGVTPAKTPAMNSSSMDVVNSLQLPQTSVAFVSELKNYVERSEPIPDSVSLLLIDTYVAEAGKDFQPSDRFADLAAALEKALKNVYKRENHVARLGGHRYGFLLRHTTDPQAYLLTRKIMQICNAVETKDALTISSTGCLYAVSSNKDKSAAQLLRLASEGLDVVNSRGTNQALLLDLRRMLPVYASQNTG